MKSAWAWCVISLVVGHSVAFAADLRERMGESVFQAAGLEKLSAAELSALEAWLNRAQTSASSSEPLVNGSPASQSAEPPTNVAAPADTWRPAVAREAFDSELSENIRGFSGSTQFTLKNGQVWQQTDGTAWQGRLRELGVRLKPASMGSWLMRFNDNNRTIRVKRVR